MTPWWPPDLAEMFATVPELGRAFLVGGCVRDWLLGVPIKDYDVEVFGVGYPQLSKALAPWGRVDLVGRSFGVLKVTTPAGHIYDFALPRRDSKVGAGHKGFAVEPDAGMTLREAAARRDFTINAMGFDPRRGALCDEFGGGEDLRHGVLRHVGPAFAEDPLRVLRGMQFASRFRLVAVPETVTLCRAIKGAYGELPGERVWGEWNKWAGESQAPSAGLRFLLATEWIEHFPEIEALVGLPQDADWHPEGDVFTHTCQSLDALIALPEWGVADPPTRLVYTLAVLAHDFGKAQVTARVLREGRERVVSPGHDQAGGAAATAFLERIHAPIWVRERVVPLVLNHMAHLQPATDRAVRRLAQRLTPETIQSLAVVIRADSLGRSPRPGPAPAGLSALLDRAASLHVREAAPKPVLLGRHLVALGMKPGRPLGQILAAAREAQLDGRFSDPGGALAWVAADAALPVPPGVRQRIHEVTGPAGRKAV